jgi:SAM-dependent methyltransferase
VLGDLTRDDLKLGQFDLVTAFRFFGNAQDDLREAALQAIHRSLRPGGYLILDNHRNPYTLNRIGRSMFAGDRLVATDQWARADLHYRKLRTLLAAHGFEIQRTKGFAWWVVLARLGQEKFFTSDWAQALERLGAIRAVAALSPAYVVAARKV